MKCLDFLLFKVVIYGFATAHVTTAVALGQTVVGNKVALTALTIAMIITLSTI